MLFPSAPSARGWLNRQPFFVIPIIIAPQAQGQGLGAELLGALEDNARDAGVHSMIAAISSQNPAGIAFHAALGDREVSVVPEAERKFDRWLDLHVLQKIL